MLKVKNKIVGKIKNQSKLKGILNNTAIYVKPKLENLEVTPSKEQQIFNHENSYGYDEVVVAPIPDTQEDLTEELNTYNTELTEQETIINRIIEALKSK